MNIHEEETLDLEERVRLCEDDTRQFLEDQPALASSLARQVLARLGNSRCKVPPLARANKGRQY